MNYYYGKGGKIYISKELEDYNQFNIEELYKEMWNVAINDKLTCETKITSKF